MPIIRLAAVKLEYLEKNYEKSFNYSNLHIASYCIVIEL